MVGRRPRPKKDRGASSILRLEGTAEIQLDYQWPFTEGQPQTVRSIWAEPRPRTFLFWQAERRQTENLKQQHLILVGQRGKS